MNRTVAAAVLASLATGVVVWMLVPRIERRPELAGDARRSAVSIGKPVSPSQSRELRRLLRSEPRIDPRTVTLDQVRQGVNQGDYALVDFDDRYWNNLEANRQANFTMFYGQPAPKGCYPEVVAVIVNGALACTGTVIGEKQVITAAHCFEGGEHRCQVHVGECYPDSSPAIEGTARCFTEPCKDSAVDVAVVDLDVAAGVAPRKLAAAAAAEKVTSVVSVGLGFDHNQRKGTKRMSRFTVASTCRGAVRLAIPIPDPVFYSCKPGSELVAGAESNTAFVCDGDSGGPVMVVDPTWKDLRIAALIKRNLKGCDTDNIFTRIDSADVLNFINSGATKFADKNCLPVDPPTLSGTVCP